MKISKVEEVGTEIRADGVGMTTFFRPESNGGIVTMGHAVFPAGTIVPWAAHDCDEYAFILDGEVCCTTHKDGKQCISAGNASFIPAGEEHSSCNESGTSATLVWMLVKPSV